MGLPSVNKQLAEGTVVTVRGLKGAPQHNGKSGRILSYLKGKGRYKVALTAEHHLMLKPANVSVSEPVGPDAPQRRPDLTTKMVQDPVPEPQQEQE